MPFMLSGGINPTALRSSAISLAIISSIPRLCTFTTTLSPVFSTALCTCAIEAEPNGTASISFNTSFHSCPQASLIHTSTSSNGIGSTSEQRCISSSQYFFGIMSDLVDRICPSFTYVGPSSSKNFLNFCGVNPLIPPYLRRTAVISFNLVRYSCVSFFIVCFLVRSLACYSSVSCASVSVSSSSASYSASSFSPASTSSSACFSLSAFCFSSFS